MTNCMVSHVISWALILSASACAPDGGEGEIDLREGAVRVRLMAANITSGGRQSYDPGHGMRIFQGMDADIVLIQEFNYGDGERADIREFVNTTFGPDFDYFRERDAALPNGLVSRYPILEAGEWPDPHAPDRDFAYARIDIPGPVDLWAVSVHLLTSSPRKRNREAHEVISYVRHNIPDGDYLVVGGDLNTNSRGESTIETLGQELITEGPYPEDHEANGNTNAPRNKPYDWVLVDPQLDALEIPVAIGASSFEHGLVVDTRVYSPLSEISPARAGDSGARNMQHMAVIRDFLVADDGVR